MSQSKSPTGVLDKTWEQQWMEVSAFSLKEEDKAGGAIPFYKWISSVGKGKVTDSDLDIQNSTTPIEHQQQHLSMDVTAAPWVTESTLQNASDWEDFDRPLDMALLISGILEFIISLVGLAGNAVVLWLLAFRMQRNAFSVYILNLAGADFVSLCTHMVSSIMTLVKDTKQDFTFLFRILFVTFTFQYVASLNILTAISTERCLSVLKPIWYRCHRPRHMSSVVCALLWALSLLQTILEMTFYEFLSRDSFKHLSGLIYLSLVMWLVFCFVLLFGSNLVLLIRLLRGSRKLKLTRLCANPIIYFFVGSYRQQRQQRRSLNVILQRALQDVPEEDGRQGSPPQETLEMSGNTHVA
ncbi:mas-related G-protein coupled receptor member X1-like [Sorex araneus]|uniref:mas-related G-protein coupled receptor member X1-like n=1 Tax=Sorex araneus TaxID=42254 RepID=UPI002433807A|nr:mas-related G-protein coupled receptor member X1-like [Sorex araneus]